MQICTNSGHNKAFVKKTNLFVFYSRLIINKYTILLMLALFVGLLSVHLTIPMSQVKYDKARSDELTAVSRFTEYFVRTYLAELDEGVEPNLNDEPLKTCLELERKAFAIKQQYSAAEKYGVGDRTMLDTNWFLLCEDIVSGVKAGTIPPDSDLILYLGEANLIETHLFNMGLMSLDRGHEQLRPQYTREQYFENVFGGTNMLGLLPFIIMAILIHNCFSQDYDTGTYKMIRTLPVSKYYSDTIRFLVYLILPAILIFASIFLASLTYVSNPDSLYVCGQGEFMSLLDYAKAEPNYSDYLFASRPYIGSLVAIYALEFLAFSSFIILLSKLSKNSFLSLTIPMTGLLFLSVPNLVETKAVISERPYSALLSAKRVLAKLAPLEMSSVVLILLGLSICFISLIILLQRPGFQKA